MAAKACVFHRSPERDYNVLVGDSVELRLRIKNCGGDRGNFYSDINKDGGAWIAKYNESLDLGELGTFLKKSFTMPNREVRVDFYGGHAWSGDWSEDFHYTAYLRPRKEYCTQEIYVKTKDGASVRATVDWGDGTSDSGTTPKTFSHQYEVVVGKSYEIKVSASGYLREIISLTLPCKSKITSVLPKKVETCEQRVRVVTSDGASVRARLDWGDGVHEDFNTPKTCFYDRYEEGKRYTVRATASGYTSASKTFTTCRSQFTLTLTKEVGYCSQNVRVVTSDGAGVYPTIYWGDGSSAYGGKTPYDETHKYEKGKSRTVTVTASGYTSASKTFTTCRSQFTLTLTKEEVPCSDWTTKSTCESHGCFWYNNSCHEYGPVKCSDYTDALTCVANNCYWWSDGTCHDTEEGAPPPDAAKFRLSEVAENHLPEWISGYACAACSGQYNYVPPAGYGRTECRTEPKGSHGCCPSCAVVFVKCEQGVAPPPPKEIIEVHSSKTFNGFEIELPDGEWYDKVSKHYYSGSWTGSGESFNITFSFNIKVGGTVVYAYPPSRVLFLDRERTYDLSGENITDANGNKLKKVTFGCYDVGGTGSTYSAYFYSFKTSVEITTPPIEKKDTVICDFDVYDAADKKVTDLVAGVRYAIKAYLCKVEGGGCAEILKGCDSGCEVSGETLKLFLFGQAAEVAKGTTNVDGYTGFYWTPSADIAGDNSIRLEFKGSAKYNASESDWKTVSVGGLRIKCDCTAIDVGDRVFLQEAKQVRGKWVHNILGGGESKKVTADKVLYFTEHDPILGFGVGKHYSIIAWKWWESYIAFKPLLNFIVPDYSVIELKEGLNEVTVRYQVSIIGTTLCGFFGIEPESTECSLFLAEFADPVFVANTLSVITKHEDLESNPREPETLDYVMLPIVMVGSLLPVVPMGKISQWTGRGLKLAKKSVASKTFLIRHHQKIHHLTTVGDEARILKFKAFFDADKLNDALKVLDEGVVASEATEVAKALKRASLRKWVRGIIAKWKVDKPKTTIQKFMDDTAEHGGNVFKTQADVIVKHVDDAKGDWTKIRKIWDDTVKTADDVVYVDFHLAGKSDDVQVMHNIMRYSKDDFVKALKAEKAGIPKFANRFDEGVDFMLRHIGDETGMEVAKYRKAIEGLSDADINNIVKNLDAVGQGNLARIIKTCKVAPEGGMKFFDDAADALKGTTKLSAKERKALGGVLDTGFDDAAKHLDDKWKAVFGKIFDTEDSIKNPQGKRFWDYIRGHGKTKDMMAKYGKTRFRDLPFVAKAAVFMSVFYVVNTAWKTMQDFCFALFMGEETIQWGGFGGIVLNNLLYKFNEKPLSEKKQIIKTFEEFSKKRHTIHDLVTGSSSIFESLCLVFGNIFKRFWEADAVNLWALDTTIEYLGEGINPYTGIGECSIKVRADKDGVDFWYQGSPTKWHGGKAFGWTEIKLVPVRATPEEVTVCAWKGGYVMATHIIKIFPEDVGKTGYNAKEMELFELIPESSVSDTPNPFGYQTPPDTTNLPPPYGNANPREYFGEVVRGSIRCESIPTGAGVYLDMKDSAHYKGKTDITLEHIPVGAHKIIQTFPKFNDCVVNVNVVVEPMVYARCRFPTPTCSFTPSTTKPKLNEVVTFDASASTPGTGATSITYDWDWGDGKPHGTKKIDTHAYVTKGVYAVKLTVTNEMGGSKVCTTNITVEVATGNIKCYCEPAEYCSRNADIYVDGGKVDVTKESGYTYIKNQTPGVHTVKYNLLDVMECSGSVTVTADKDIDFSCQLKSKLPASQTAKVTAIVDGDGIRTNITDALPVPSGQTHQTVRIVGYDAYECRVYPSDCTTFGKYAYDELKRHIPIGTSITLKIDEWLPLGAHNRVIAGVFVGAKDIVAEMLKSCLVSITEKKYRDRYYWITWADYERIWCDPKETVASAEHKPTIIDIDIRRKTFKIYNNWLTLWLLAEFVDSGGSVIGRIPERQVEGGRASSAITYFAGTYAIKLYARVDKKEDWTLVDTRYVAVPTKTVTFNSVPRNAAVTVVKVGSAGALRVPSRLARALKRVKTI